MYIFASQRLRSASPSFHSRLQVEFCNSCALPFAGFCQLCPLWYHLQQTSQTHSFLLTMYVKICAQLTENTTCVPKNWYVVIWKFLFTKVISFSDLTKTLLFIVHILNKNKTHLFLCWVCCFVIAKKIEFSCFIVIKTKI